MARRPSRSPRNAAQLAFRTDDGKDDNIPDSLLDLRLHGKHHEDTPIVEHDTTETAENVKHRNVYASNQEEIVIDKDTDDDAILEDIEDVFLSEKIKNVWGEDDDFIAERISERVKRDLGDNSDSDKVVSSDKGEEMWDIEPADLTDCDCLGPPPEFMLPPPPRPPFLQTDYYCGDDPIPDLETCDTEPKIDAYNHSSPSFQTSAAIALCSVVLVLGILVGAVLIWKHKRKVTNLFPSKSTGSSAPAGSVSCRMPAPAPLYEDLNDFPLRTPHRQNLGQQLEMVECKRGAAGCGGGRVFVCGAGPGGGGGGGGGTWRGGGCGGDVCGAPLYEELPHRSDDSLHSDDHFAEDELSLVGEADPRIQGCRACPARPPVPHSLPHRGRPRLDRRPRSLERRRAQHRPRQQAEPAEFHEGVLLDALLRLYPSVGTVGARVAPPGGAGGAWPGGGELAGVGCWRGPRASPKPPSGDSSFGSDSGYSNNTCGTCGTRGSSRHRLSAEMPLS